MRGLTTTARLLLLAVAATLILAGCTAVTTPESAAETEGEVHLHEDGEEHLHTDEAGAEAEDHSHESLTLSLPALDPVDLNGRKLRVVATTSLIGDTAVRVGGDAIDLTVLMEAGQDPHSFQPGAQDLTAVAEADVILINGWDLEEGLVDDLANIGGGVPLVAVSANITPIELGEHSHDPDVADDHEHEFGGIDPHVWMDVRSVEVWADNIAQIFGALDPAQADAYSANAAAYDEELAALHSEINAQVLALPLDARVLVTNHDALRYFALAYGFEIAGTVIPAASTLAEPSASGLAALTATMQERGVCTIFAETTASDQLAQTLAGELSDCDTVQVVALYTGALGSAGSGAETYIDMMRTNTNLIMQGLGAQ